LQLHFAAVPANPVDVLGGASAFSPATATAFLIDGFSLLIKKLCLMLRYASSTPNKRI
jgi:hypothetical protein